MNYAGRTLGELLARRVSKKVWEEKEIVPLSRGRGSDRVDKRLVNTNLVLYLSNLE